MPEPVATQRWAGPDLILNLRVRTRAPRDELVGLAGDRLKLRITAAPVDGKANTHLLRFLARLFRVSRSQVVLESGAASRDKRVRVHAPTRLPEPLGSE
jgi:uncharacterized protein (TIGR00251 family)